MHACIGKNKPLRRFSSRLSSSTMGSEWPWPWNFSLPWSTSPRLPISFSPAMLIRKTRPQASYSSGCYSASGFCCSHLMIGGRASCTSKRASVVGLYGAAGFFRGTPLSPLSLREEIDLRSGGRMSAVEEKARRPGRGPRRQMEPCPKVTRVAQSWNESDADMILVTFSWNRITLQNKHLSQASIISRWWAVEIGHLYMLVWYIPI